MSEVRFRITKTGRLVCFGEGGKKVYPAQPVLRFKGCDPPYCVNASCARARKGEWLFHLAPVGLDQSRKLVCSLKSIDRGRHGEARFHVELVNTGEGEVVGTLLPPFTGWTGGTDVSPDHFALVGLQAYMGSSVPHFAWAPTEFIHDVFSTVPALNAAAAMSQKGSFYPNRRQPDDGQRTYLTASLVYESGGSFGRPPGSGLKLEAGETAAFTLHLDSGSGGRPGALREIYRGRGGYRVDPVQYSFAQYQDPSLRWVKDQVVTWLNWAWDREVMDPVTGEYRLIESLEQAKKRFGGFDVFELWPFWPRAGFDDRLQFDHFLQMPGGIEGLRSLIGKAQELGTRIVISYYVWCETDRTDSPKALKESYRKLVDLALDVGADGVLMDIMSTTPEEIREAARSRGRELAPYNEWDPGWAESQTNLIGRIHNSVPMPRFNLKRYMLPHHPILRVCEPGNEGKVMRNDLIVSFFQGHGVEINSMFPQSNPACEEDWPILARAADILRTNRRCFSSQSWDPLVAVENESIWANRWPSGEDAGSSEEDPGLPGENAQTLRANGRGPGKILYTLCGTDPRGFTGALIRVPRVDNVHYLDLWRYRPLSITEEDGHMVLAYEMEGFASGRGMEKGSGDYSPGCIAVLPMLLECDLDFEMLEIRIKGPCQGKKLEIWEHTVDPGQDPVVVDASERIRVDLYQALGKHTNKAIVARLMDEENQLLDAAVVEESLVRFFRIDKPESTAPLQEGPEPESMVRIPKERFDYEIQQTQPVWQATYANMWHVYSPAPAHSRRVEAGPFWMDRYPVTNGQYHEFLRDSGYAPEHKENFLKHFVDGKPPKGRENHPVVYVSYHDARAYAEWAGKRLPTEEEWQLAAGGTEKRKWPWGDEEPNPDLCVMDGPGTQSVTAHPAGASPYGVQDLAGNVWQWTASLMDNGRHTVVFVRGGGWYRSPEGMWWVKGGPRPITDHFPLPLFGPSMNRFSTVGFRCVRDC